MSHVVKEKRKGWAKKKKVVQLLSTNTDDWECTHCVNHSNEEVLVKIMLWEHSLEMIIFIYYYTHKKVKIRLNDYVLLCLKNLTIAEHSMCWFPGIARSTVQWEAESCARAPLFHLCSCGFLWTCKGEFICEDVDVND